METTLKKKYFSPEIEMIILDNEISLALASDPPFGPDESRVLKPEYFNNDPMKSQMV